MDIREILRLAGSNEDNDSFESAMGIKRPGKRLEEARGIDALRGPMGYPGPNYRLSSCVRVGTAALGEVCEVLHGLWSGLDRIRYGEETGSEAAKKIQEGPLAAIEQLVKGVGFALTRSFDSYKETEGGRGYPMVCCGGDSLDTECLHLRGEVAEAMAILKIVAKDLDKASARDVSSVDLDLWKKAWPAFQKGIDDRVDVLCDAIEKLEVRTMPMGGKMYAEERSKPLHEAEFTTDYIGGGSYTISASNEVLLAMQKALPKFFSRARIQGGSLFTKSEKARKAGVEWLTAQGHTQNHPDTRGL